MAQDRRMIGIAHIDNSRSHIARTCAAINVIGTPAARITSTGIRAAGTRKATLPVLAVTFSGRRDEAFTMMVSGPGQYLRVIS